MNKLFYLLSFLFIPVCIFGQTVNEKSLIRFDNLPQVQAYSLYVDEKSGTYLYSDYDTTSKKTTLYSNKGNSEVYDYINYYGAIFDAEGNYYVTAYNNLTDTTFIYFMLKNGKEISKFDMMSLNWKDNSGKIYFSCKEGDKSYLAAYDMISGNISKGKIYDDVILCSFPKSTGSGDEGDEDGEIGFTSGGDPFYIAKANNEAFLVVGTQEQKHYADMDTYTFTQDPAGNFVYAAKSSGAFYNDAGNAFIVQGTNEYKKFDYIYGPVLFDNSGTAIYIGGDSTATDNPQRVMIGNKEAGKSYSLGVSNLQLTPNGKLLYIATELIKNGDENVSFVVFDGKEGKRYQAIGITRILPNSKILYVATVSDDKQVIVRGNEEIDIDQPTILDVDALQSGELTYISGKYGDYDKKEKDKFYVHIGDDELGPFDGAEQINYDNNEYIISDKSGNYLYLVTKVTDFKTYTSKEILYSKEGKVGEFDNI